MMERVQGRPEAPAEAKNLLSGRPEARSEAKNLLSGRPEAPAEAKNLLSGRPEARSEAKNLLSGRPEAHFQARNSDLRHGNRDSHINFMKRVPLSGQKSNKSKQIEQIKKINL